MAIGLCVSLVEIRSGGGAWRVQTSPVGLTRETKNGTTSKFGPTPRASRAAHLATQGRSGKRTILDDRELIGLAYRMLVRALRVPREKLEPLPFKNSVFRFFNYRTRTAGRRKLKRMPVYRNRYRLQIICASQRCTIINVLIN